MLGLGFKGCRGLGFRGWESPALHSEVHGFRGLGFKGLGV